MRCRCSSPRRSLRVRYNADYVHEVDELVMVVVGEVDFEIDGVTHRPGVGEELLIPARARHTVRNVGGTESRWLYGYAS